MRKLGRTLLIIGLSTQAIVLSLNAANAGQHSDANKFAQLLDDRSAHPDPFLDKIGEQKGYAEFMTSIEKTFKPNENILCRFNIDNYGRIKDLKVCSEKKPTVLEKKLMSMINKAAPFPYPTKREMIDQGVEIEFWKRIKTKDNSWAMSTAPIVKTARIAPLAHRVAAQKQAENETKKNPSRDIFKDLRNNASY